MHYRPLRKGLAGLSLIALLMAAGSASAVPVALRLSADAVTVTCYDGDPLCDSNPLERAVTFVGSVGSWLTNITTALTAPVLGTADHAVLHMDDVNLSSASGGTISIMASASDFTGPLTASGAPMSAALGGVTGGRVDADFYLDDGNGMFAMPVGGMIGHLDSTQGVSGAAFASSVGRVISGVGAPFSLTIAAVVSHASGAATSFNAQIPEPPVGWLVLGLVALVMARRGRVGGSCRVSV